MSLDAIQSQITQIATESVNIPLVIVLLAIGYILKHWVKPIVNDSIPLVLLITGIVFALIINIPFKFQEEILVVLVKGIVSGAAAVGIHTQGRTIIDIIKSVKNTDKTTE